MLLNYWIWPALALMFIAGYYLTRALRSRESQRRIAMALGGAALALVAGLLAFEIYRIIYHVVAPHLTDSAPFSDPRHPPSGR